MKSWQSVKDLGTWALVSLAGIVKRPGDPDLVFALLYFIPSNHHLPD